MVGITGYGTYIPRYRLKMSDIADLWQKNADEITSCLRLQEKAVPYYDEDSVTMAIEAGKHALESAHISPEKISALYIGSESHPYAVNPSSTIVGEYLGIGPNYFASDMEFACKAGSASMQIITSLIMSKHILYGMAIGSDAAQGKPHDALEYTATSAAVAFILGENAKEILANILYMSSYTSDTPDFCRRDGEKYPSHFNRFTGEPGYFTHIISEGEKLLKQSKMKPQDFDYCVFHMPNGKFPRVVAKKLGFSPQQLEKSLTVDAIGNPYSASSLLGLAAVLDIAKPNQKIFFVSYGSGAGSDGFIFKTTENIIKKREQTKTVAAQIAKKEYISYAQYLRQTHKISL